MNKETKVDKAYSGKIIYHGNKPYQLVPELHIYINDIREKVINSYIEDGEDKETAQFIVDYFEYIYGKREEREEE